ncbi:unnamed protein product [Lota lota]
MGSGSTTLRAHNGAQEVKRSGTREIPGMFEVVDRGRPQVTPSSSPNPHREARSILESSSVWAAGADPGSMGLLISGQN